jgi:CobQ-like glutamine amidotransferase family enzyme
MIAIGHLYPELLNLYGDRGNILALSRRCQWRGIAVRVDEIGLGTAVDFDRYDILFLGGGSDREQALITADLRRRAPDLGRAIDGGLVVLAICGGYQLLGSYYLARDGRKIPGLGVIDFYTVAGNRRLVGNIAVEIGHDAGPLVAVGFENHSGQTFLNGLTPMGRVLRGHGNNGHDAGEGIRFKNVFGTYLHGPLLPKNPDLADRLIGLARERRGDLGRLEPLDDDLERSARRVMLKRLGISGYGG